MRIRVPGVVKRSLTSMQITQFVFGTAMAAAYLFVSYSIPFESAKSSAAVASSWLKKIGVNAQQPTGVAQDSDNHMVPCLHSNGQGFAVWLNVSYLLPLTFLFLRFFVRSYLYRKEPSVPQPTHIHAAEKAGLDALRGVSREIQKAVEVNGETSEATEDETAIKALSTVAPASAPSTTAPATPPQDSPIRTRSTTAKKSTTTRQAPSGFSPVKNGAAKGGATNGTLPAETTNPYEVLGKP